MTFQFVSLPKAASEEKNQTWLKCWQHQILMMISDLDLVRTVFGKCVPFKKKGQGFVKNNTEKN